VHDATTNDNRVFCCEEEEEDHPHTLALREGGGVLGEGIIIVVDFFCAVFSSFVFIKSMYVLLRIEVYIIGSGRFFFFLRGGGAFFFFGRIVV